MTAAARTDPVMIRLRNLSFRYPEGDFELRVPELVIRSGEQVVVISEAAADQLFLGEEALGKRIVVGLEQELVATVVGVVADVKSLGLDQDSPPTLYRPFRQAGATFERLSWTTHTLVLRTDGLPEGLAAQVREAVRSLDRNALITAIRSMPEAISDSMSGRRVTMILLSLFTSTAVLLGAIGVYGVMGYSVRERTKEIGIRIALGASRGRVLREVLFDAMKIAGVGTAIGLAVALALSRTLESFVFGIEPTDPWVLAAATAMSIAVALLASYVPARRAGVADPMEALSTD